MLETKQALGAIGKRPGFCIAPSLRYEFSEDTSATVRANYQDHRFRYHFGSGVQCLCADLSQAQPGDFVIQGVDRSVFFGQEWNRAEKRISSVGTRSARFQMRQNVRQKSSYPRSLWRKRLVAAEGASPLGR